MAVASLTSTAPTTGKVEFYRLFSSLTEQRTTSYKSYKLATEVAITNSYELDSAKFVAGDFIWQTAASAVPSLIRACSNIGYLNSSTHLCSACQGANSGTSQLLQSQCVSCGTLWWYESNTQSSALTSIEYATAF